MTAAGAAVDSLRTRTLRHLTLLQRAARELPPALRAKLGIGERAKIALARSIPARPRIGLAVLAHERPEALALCLDSLFATRLAGHDVTVLLIDRGSNDPRVREILETPRCEGVRVVRRFTDDGPAVAAGTIARAMRELGQLGAFDIVGWSDPDLLYHPDWLDHLIALVRWTKGHHARHELGSFSVFNSSDHASHGVLGRFESPEGAYIVKRGTDAGQSFYLMSDLDALGALGARPDEVGAMAALKVRTICSATSWVERLAPSAGVIRRPVSGLHLAREGWPATIAAADTLGYYRDIEQPRSLADGVRSDAKLDVVIPAIDKDLASLPLAVRGVKENLAHPLGEIYLLGPAGSQVAAVATSLGCRFVDERELLPFGKDAIDYRIGGYDRAGWVYQQLLKLASDTLTSGNDYLLMDADTALMRPQVFRLGDRHVLLHSDEFNAPYFEVCARLLGWPPRTLLSCVAHNMAISVPRLRALRAHLEQRHGKPWHEAILAAVDYSAISGFSEYELYGQWCLERYPETTEREYFFNQAIPAATRDYDALRRRFGHNRSVSVHSYLGLSTRLAAMIRVKM